MKFIAVPVNGAEVVASDVRPRWERRQRFCGDAPKWSDGDVSTRGGGDMHG